MTLKWPKPGQTQIPPGWLNLLVTITAASIILAGCAPIDKPVPTASQLSNPAQNTLVPSLQVTQPTSDQATTSPQPSPTQTPFPFNSLIDQVLQNAGGHWNIVIKQVNGELLYSRDPDENISVASIIKLPVAILFLKSLEPLDIPSGGLITYLASNGVGEFSYAELLHGMLVYSDEDFTDILIEAIRADGLNTSLALQEWGMDINIYNRVTSAGDITRIWQGLYLGEYISAEGRSLLLDLLSEVTENDATRLGFICAEFSSGCTIYNKRGTITDEILVVADSALITVQTDAGQQAYIISIFGSQGDPPTDYYRLNDAIAEIGLIFADYLAGR